MKKKIRIHINAGLSLKVMFLTLLAGFTFSGAGQDQYIKPFLQYTVSIPDPVNHLFHVELNCHGWKTDTIDFKMPRWMPGYYQIMEYSDEVENISASRINGKEIPVVRKDQNTWRIIVTDNSPFVLSYDINANRKFVANSYLDSTHGYIVPAATFMYIDRHLNTPVRIKIGTGNRWTGFATGLEQVQGKINEFSASDFDILYDCPILLGDLEEFPAFDIKGIRHRFIAYNPGTFNRELFMGNLKKAIQAGVDIIGEVPYNQYIFIGIGPGYGGIEHLNNATVSFDGSGLGRKESMNRMIKFLAHEYFHNYNVKRIRPYELGPFDYSRENKTNLLWVSEGLTVYYEYLIVRRAGLISEQDLFASLEGNINAFENDPGRHFQSLVQASYNTWTDGPFGNKATGTDRAISYYDKGPIIGMILDFSIRNSTQNEKSLDDVMRFLYMHYYKKLQRGFTDAEFQQACEDIAGISLSREFEYVNTVKDLDYTTYLSYAGLRIAEELDKRNGKKKFTISRSETMNPAESSVFKSWSVK